MSPAKQVETCAHEAATLLPWFVNGTLNPEERQTVEDHLAVCAVCPEALVDLLKVQSVLHRELAEAPEPSIALWQKVRSRISEPSVSRDRPAARPLRLSAWAWLGDLVSPVLRPGWLIAALVLIIIQAAIIVGLVARGPSQVGPEYRTLTGPPMAGQPSGPRARFRVAFNEEASEKAIRAALEEVKATIVDGPSAAGFYLIDVPIDGGAVKSPEEARRALHAHPEVVRFAELAAQ